MPAAADRIDYGPPRDAGSVRAFGLALLAHALLIAALTWGVNWKRSATTPAFEAELWSAQMQQAAPKLIEPPPEPLAAPPPPAPAEPVAKPAPVKIPPPAIKPAPPVPDVDIALERAKKRKLEKIAQERELAKKEKLLETKRDQEKQAKAEKLAAKTKAAQLAAQKLADSQAEKKAEKLAEKQANAQAEAQAQKLAQQQAKKQEQKQREDALNRMMGLAGASGSATATGSAQKSSGPSASYGAKVIARVKPNIVFTADVQGNPSAEVEVRSALDGTITSQRLVKSSGNKAWDDAVIKAIVRTQTMPRDVDGRVPAIMIIEFRPKD